MNGWNLTNSVINVGKLMLQNQPGLINISESSHIWETFFSYNGPRRGHLCHTDTALVHSDKKKICVS